MAPISKAGSTKRNKGSFSHLVWLVAVIIAFVVGVQTGLISSHSATVANTGTSSALITSTKKSVGGSGAKDSFKLAFEQSYGFFDDISDYNWKLMKQRAQSRINHKFASSTKFYSEPARWYMNNFEPDFTCAQERRVGGPGDGPKWVCDPHRLPDIVERRSKQMSAEKAGCLIYSVGSGGKWQFEDGMYEMLDGLCEIHVFDPGNFAKFRDDLVGRNVHFRKLIDSLNACHVIFICLIADARIDRLLRCGR